MERLIDLHAAPPPPLEPSRHWGVVGLGWVGSRLAPKVVTRPVCPYLTGSIGYPPLVVWSHSRPDC